MSGSRIVVSRARKPQVVLLLSFVWLLLAAGFLGCVIAKTGDPPDGSPLYYLCVRPLAALAPMFGSVWLLAVLLPHWSRISRMQKGAVFSALFGALALCTWVFFTVWRMRA